MDLIVGLPGEDIHMVERTLEQVRELAPDSITAVSYTHLDQQIQGTRESSDYYSELLLILPPVL